MPNSLFLGGRSNWLEHRTKMESKVKSRAASIFTSGVQKLTALDAAFPQEKPHFAELDRASQR
jgi:hypothetical protein